MLPSMPHVRDQQHEALPIVEAARRLGVPPAWLRGEIDAGQLPALKAGSAILVHVPTIAALLAERAKGEAVSP